jgi:Na+/proline symporter
MKAVVWTDVFQSLVMISGLLAIVIQVLYSAYSMTVLCHAVKMGEGITSYINATNVANYELALAYTLCIT